MQAFLNYTNRRTILPLGTHIANLSNSGERAAIARMLSNPRSQFRSAICRKENPCASSKSRTKRCGIGHLSEDLNVIDWRGHDQDRVQEMIEVHSAGVLAGEPTLMATCVSKVRCRRFRRGGPPIGNARASCNSGRTSMMKRSRG